MLSIRRYMTLLRVDAASSASSVWGGGIFEILFILIVFVCILFLAYVVTRFIAKRSSGRLKSRHMEVVDSLAVGADSQLLIIKAGDEYFLTSKTQKQIVMLAKLALTAEDTQDSAVRSTGFADSFRSVLESKLSRAKPQRDKTADSDNDGGAGGDTDAGGDTGGGRRERNDRNDRYDRTENTGVFRSNIDKIKEIK